MPLEGSFRKDRPLPTDGEINQVLFGAELAALAASSCENAVPALLELLYGAGFPLKLRPYGPLLGPVKQ